MLVDWESHESIFHVFLKVKSLIALLQRLMGQVETIRNLLQNG